MPTTREDFFRLARTLADESKIPGEIQSYFEQHRDRLWETIEAFDLLSSRHKRMLEIGPYFSYTPFLWKEAVADEVAVFEGAAAEPMLLEKLYRARGIEIHYGDLFRTFDETIPSERKLPYPSDSFEMVTCWETMEHFNFNPVPFVREVRRILKTGGAACITVPNIAKFDKRLKLMCGKSIATPLRGYFDHAGSKFYGFHWREYTLAELTELFRQNDFVIETSAHLQTFENRPSNLLRGVKRTCARALTAVFPGTAALCLIKARKK
jgi:SAM-dependent methyltransferase